MHRSRPLVLTAAVLAMSPAVAPASTQSASSLLTTAFKDAVARGAAHEASTIKVGRERITFSCDLTNTGGRQVIADNAGDRAVVELVDRVAYVSGNAKGLVKYLGLSSKAAATVGRRWVSIPSSASAYSAVANGVTLPSALVDIAPSGSLTSLPATGGLIGVRGSSLGPVGLAGTLTTYVSQAAAPLPVRTSVTISAKGHAQTSVTTLSRWGEHVRIAKPASAVPISTLLVTKL